jgi:methylated-DNA-[protein]-cysteine S-methyltransferase
MQRPDLWPTPHKNHQLACGSSYLTDTTTRIVTPQEDQTITNTNKDKINYLSILSPVGWLTLFETSKKIIALEWGRATNCTGTPTLKAAVQELIEYFNNERTSFTIALQPTGTVFQKSVWNYISEIPYGQTRTYGEIANQINSAARPVGSACRKNPIPLFVPCHRVIGANNKLTGFSGGLGVQTKQDLLKHETHVNNAL